MWRRASSQLSRAVLFGPSRSSLVHLRRCSETPFDISKPDESMEAPPDEEYFQLLLREYPNIASQGKPALRSYM